MLLERFRTAKQDEIQALRNLEARGELPPALTLFRPDFAAALSQPPKGRQLAVVAEYKRASPSRGEICENLEVEVVARQYAAAGASAVSVLTEETFFHGRLNYLDRAVRALSSFGARVPVLRKDFIFDPLQIRATAATPASALLLIARLTPDAGELRHLRELAESFGIQAVVEVFDAEDLLLARESGARIIQVNARDLETLSVDRKACLQLAREHPPLEGEIWVAASGICSACHLQAAAGAGYSAALVGSALMEGGQPGAALASLLETKTGIGGEGEC